MNSVQNMLLGKKIILKVKNMLFINIYYNRTFALVKKSFDTIVVGEICIIDFFETL